MQVSLFKFHDDSGNNYCTVYVLVIFLSPSKSKAVKIYNRDTN